MKDPVPVAGTHNELSGTAGVAMQGRDFHGVNIHLHHSDSPKIAPRQLPRDISYFTGRRDEIEFLDGLLGNAVADDEASSAVSLITGMAGVGKTALAVRWGHKVRNYFPDGDFYVNLQGYGPGRPLTPGQCLEGFLAAMGVPAERIPQELGMRAAMFRTLLDGRRMLIILDNAYSAEQVRHFLPGSRGSLVVVTSRSRLPGLIARDGAHLIILRMLASDEANVLLSKIVGSRIAAEPHVASSIVRSCGHLPLALRIAAEHAVTHPKQALADLALALAHEKKRLDIVSPSGDDSTALRSVFSWSYHALQPELARAFRLLGIHCGPEISSGAAAALADTDATVAARLIEGLSAVHLIEEPISGRYRFHDLLRVYAADRARADELPAARTEAIERVLLWYLHTASAVRTAISMSRPKSPFALPAAFRFAPVLVPVFTTHQDALSWCDAELGNLVAAVQQAVDLGRYDIACWLPVALQPYFQRHAIFGPWYETHIVGLEAAVAINDQRAEAELHRGIGSVLYHQGRYEESFAHQRKALYGYRDLGWEGEIILVNLGAACEALHQYDESFEYLSQAVGAARQTGYRNAEAFALLNLGATCQSLGRLEESAGHLGDAINVFHDTHDRFGLGLALNRMAYSHLRRGEMPDAVGYLNQALGNAREIGHLSSEAWALESLGVVAYHLSQDDSAVEAWHNALKVYEKLMDDQSAARVRAQLADPGTPPAIPNPRW